MEEYNNHTFAICAYKESKYLEQCIQSLKKQTVKSNIIITTSTPNKHIEELAIKYQLKLYVNTGKTGIGEDWNYAVSACNTDLVTIAHQDDIYDKYYLKEILDMFQKYENTIIAFTDYGELRDGKEVSKNSLLKAKRIMLFPLRIFKKSKRSKKIGIIFWKFNMLSKCNIKYKNSRTNPI